MTIEVTYNVTDIYISSEVSPIYIDVNYQTSGSGAAVWGGITGTLSNQTDLQTALDGKFDDPTGTTAQYIRGNGTLATFPTITSGTVTSVGLTMPSAFSVSNSPVTTSGNLTVSGAGTTDQYVRGDGTLGIFPSQGGGGGGTVYYLNGNTSQGSIGGTTMYQLSKAAGTGVAANFTRSTTGTIASFITDAGDPNQLTVPAGIWVFECYFSESGGGSNHAQIQAVVEKWNGTTITVLGTGVVEEITNGNVKDLYQMGVTIPNGTTLSLTDRIVVQLQISNANGKTVTLYTEDSNLSSVTTTFANGLSSLNGLTATAQTFGVGTSGTDFAIVSSSSVHTFNLPTASASNRGALSSTDWSTFNGKESALTFSSPLSRSTNTVSIPAATSSVNGYLSNTDWSTFNSKQGTITLTTTGTSGAATLVGNTLNIPQYSGGGGMAIGGSITSATAGSVLFAGTSGVLAQDNSNLFWDNTNKRLGIGTNAPISSIETYNTTLYVAGAFSMYSNTASDEALFYFRRGRGTLASPVGVSSGDVLGSIRFAAQVNTTVGNYNTNAKIDAIASANGASLRFFTNNSGLGSSLTQYLQLFGTGNFVLQNGGTFTDAGYRLDVNGGARVQGAFLATGNVKSNAQVQGLSIALNDVTVLSEVSQRLIVSAGSWHTLIQMNKETIFNGTSINASAMVQIDSTTKGFLPPRMTTTQKNAISSPAAGLMVYDTTLNKLCVYTTAWETITSV